MNKMKLVMAVMLILILLGVTACKNGSDKTMNVNFYYVNADGTKLISEGREVPEYHGEKAVYCILEELLKGPQKPENRRIIPEGTKINKITMEGSLVRIDFSSQFLNETEPDRIFSRLSVVSTLTEVNGIEQVEILVDGEALMTESGKAVGILSKEDIVYDTEPAALDRKYVKLYFADQSGENLAAEAREIIVTQKDSAEMNMLKELIKGPENKQLSRTIPAETKVLSVETKEGVCFVNLSQEFKTKHTGGTSAEMMAIYSIVNSLTELEGIEKVQFLIEGQKNEVYLHMVFNEPFVKNEDLIK